MYLMVLAISLIASTQNAWVLVSAAPLAVTLVALLIAMRRSRDMIDRIDRHRAPLARRDNSDWN
jgi:hypothetical protein